MFHFKVRKKRTALAIDLGGSQYTSQSYDHNKGQYVFNVEQGRRFHLSYGANTNPTLSARDVELYKNHEHLPRSEGGTITLEGSYMDIQAVNRTYEGDYAIKASSGEQVSFELKVKGE